MQENEQNKEYFDFNKMIPEELWELIKCGTEQNCKRLKNDNAQKFIKNEFELFISCILCLMGSGITSLKRIYKNDGIIYGLNVRQLFDYNSISMYLSCLTCYKRTEENNDISLQEQLEDDLEVEEEEIIEEEIQNNQQNIQAVSREQNADQSNSCLNNIVKSINLFRQHWRQFQEKQDFYVIDESMLAFKGRSKNTVIVPHKPTPKGFKFFCVCNTKTGYCYDFFLHQHNIQDNRVYIFDNLLNPIYKKFKSSFTVIADNYFICSKVFDNTQKRYKILGTIKKNMYTKPHEIPKVKDGQSICFKTKSNYVTEIKIKNKDQFQFGHSVRYLNLPSKFLGRNFDYDLKQGVDQVQQIYNEHYHGVDMFDQYLSYIKWPLRTKCWRSLVTIRLLQMAIVNSFIKYKNNNEKSSITLIDYKDQIAIQMIKINLQQLRIQDDDQFRALKKHFPIKAEYLECSKLRRQNNCFVCFKRRTIWACTCGLPVCLKCFGEHIKMIIYENSLFFVK